MEIARRVAVVTDQLRIERQFLETLVGVLDQRTRRTLKGDE
jgi:hypothetical protein